MAVAQFDSPGEHDDPRKLDAIKAWGAGPEALDNLNAIMECAVRDGTKLLRRDGELKLYDLGDDPLEERPRAVAPADAPPDLLAALDGQPAGPVVAPAADAAADRLRRGARPHRGADADARIPLRRPCGAT